MFHKAANLLQPDNSERLEAVFRLLLDLADVPCFDARPLMDADALEAAHLRVIRDKLALILSVAAADDPRRSAILVRRFPAMFGVGRVRP